MTDFEIPVEFPKDLPKNHCAQTTKLWTSAIIVAVGIRVCESKKMTALDQQAKFFAEYKDMAPTFSSIFSSSEMPDEISHTVT